MNNHKTLYACTSLLTGIFLISSCSSSDDSGGGATVPANAITITAANAETTVRDAVDSESSLDSIPFAAETTQVISLKQALELIKPALNNASNSTAVNVATGVDFSENCSNGGSISGSATDTNDGTNISDSGSISFNSCSEASFFINGAISYSYTENIPSGNYTDNFSGSISLSADGGNLSINFSNAVFAESGNFFDGTYTVSQLSYSIDFVSDGAGSGGFLVTLTAPIVESNGDFCPESGHITITGANGTTAEGIYNGDGTMTIKANGEIVNATAFCYN